MLGIINQSLSGSSQPVPTVGMAATICLLSDRRAATVIWVSKSGKKVRVQRDKWKIIEGSEFNGSAKYEYESDPDGLVDEFSLRRNGRWVRVGSSQDGTGLLLGVRERYYDPHF